MKMLTILMGIVTIINISSPDSIINIKLHPDIVTAIHSTSPISVAARGSDDIYVETSKDKHVLFIALSDKTCNFEKTNLIIYNREATYPIDIICADSLNQATRVVKIGTFRKNIEKDTLRKLYTFLKDQLNSEKNGCLKLSKKLYFCRAKPHDCKTDFTLHNYTLCKK